MNKHKKLIFLILLLFIETAVLITIGFHKEGMHFDEFFSYFNTNNSYGREAYDRSWVSSENIKKDFYVLPGERFNYANVIRLQSYDVHPPVYYLFLHTVCSLTCGIYSMWQGIGLNIFFSLVITVFLYLIINRFIKNDIVSTVICLMMILNPGFISNVMFIRMYCLMTMFIVIQIYIHILMADRKELKNIPTLYMILSSIITYLGFLTHYFYLVFLFFLEAAFLIPHLSKIKTEFKHIAKYSLFVLFAGIAGVLSYPSCLGQVNSGYRGVEVKGYMTDLSDIGMRFRFFGGLIDRFVFNDLGYFILLIICLLFVTALFIRSSEKKNPGIYHKYESYKDTGLIIRFLIIPTFGYFIISSKGSLIGDEAMMRYQLPIYPLILSTTAIVIYCLISYLFRKKAKMIILISLVMGGLFIISDIISVKNGGVYYLYPENKQRVDISKANRDKTCIYLYNTENNKYFIWSDSDQLWQFDRVYFADVNNPDPVDDPVIKGSDELIVFISKLDQLDDPDLYIDMIKRSDPKVTSFKKLYETEYAGVYEFY